MKTPNTNTQADLLEILTTIKPNNGKVLVCPINQEDPENIGSASNYENEVRRMRNLKAGKWNGAKCDNIAKQAKIGDVLAFVHAAIDEVEYYLIVETSAPGTGRKHWNLEESDRHVVTISPIKIHDSNYEFLCKSVINQKHIGCNGNVTRIPGNRLSNINSNI